MEELKMDEPTASRNFYSWLGKERGGRARTTNETATNPEILISHVKRSIVGGEEVFLGPYGKRSIRYCDWTASGRSVGFLEDYIRHEVLPRYANTHTTTSITGTQTSLFRTEARRIIASAARCSKDDVVLFTGSGSSGAIHKLVAALKPILVSPSICDSDGSGSHAVVFIGPYEHHSNILPWKESGAKVVMVREGTNGGVDKPELKRLLEEHSDFKVKIGSFSAASNVSGILEDDREVTRLLKSNGALAFWDYATAAPYVDLDMNPGNQEMYEKDAIFLSPHKFLGGVGSPGVLIVKKRLLTLSNTPTGPGGGTIFFVGRTWHRYIGNLAEKEEGGTQDIVGSVRAALAFQLRDAITTEHILKIERSHSLHAIESLRNVENLFLLGSLECSRLPIFSFVVKAHKYFLHFNFVSALLNDLFGIQSRGGCVCAGPYGLELLGISEEQALEIEEHLLKTRELLRPGFVRVNLHYTMTETDVNFVIEAIKFIASDGWRFLPDYSFYDDTGEWRHRSMLNKFVDRRSLGFVTYRGNKMGQSLPPGVPARTGPAPDSAACLEAARKLASQASMERVYSNVTATSQVLPEEASHLKWFLLPSEAAEFLRAELWSGRSAPAKCPPRPPATTLFSVPRIAKLPPLHREGGALVPPDEGGASPGARGESKDDALSAKFKEMSEWVCARFGRGKEGALALKSAAALGVVGAAYLAVSATSGSPLGCKAETSKTSRGGQIVGTSLVALASASAGALATYCLSAAVGKSHANPLKRELDLGRRPRGGSIELLPKVAKTKEQGPHAELINNYKGACISGACSVPKGNCAPTGMVEHSPICGNCFHHHALGEARCLEASCNCVDWVQLRGKKLKRHYPKGEKLEKKLRGIIGKAIRDYAMIKEGDRVLVALSGGKDSLTMLNILIQLQRRAPIHFEIGACTVDPAHPDYDPSPLRSYLERLGIPYFYEQQQIMKAAQNCMDEKNVSFCSFCSRMKRGVLYQVARREKFTVLALGQHADDLAESFLMSLFFNGVLRTQKAHYVAAGDGGIRVIRPMLGVRERLCREYADLMDLPVVADNCPACFEAPQERMRMKKLLAGQENLHEGLFQSIMRGIAPLMRIGRTNSVEEMENKSVAEILKDEEEGATRTRGTPSKPVSRPRPREADPTSHKGPRPKGAAPPQRFEQKPEDEHVKNLLYYRRSESEGAGERREAGQEVGELRTGAPARPDPTTRGPVGREAAASPQNTSGPPPTTVVSPKGKEQGLAGPRRLRAPPSRQLRGAEDSDNRRPEQGRFLLYWDRRESAADGT